MSWGIDASLELADDLALVLDIHHHWVRTGEYIRPSDDRFKRIVDSWRGVRPAIHYSVSREDLLDRHAKGKKPNMNSLLEQGYKKQKLRAHSDYMWNRAVNDWALEFLDHADIMVESKAKNLASHKLYKYYYERGTNRKTDAIRASSQDGTNQVSSAQRQGMERIPTLAE